MTRARKLTFAVVMLALVAGAVELGSFVFFRWARGSFEIFEPDSYTVEASLIANVLRRAYHPTLGWKTRYPTRFGERPREVHYERDLLATFGDSFTHCDEVGDDETWQTHLARTVGANVYNFGNGGYGTDQALLRFEEDFPAVGTPLVSMGLILENINRVVNRYRKFYYPSTGIPATKPRFVLQGGELELIPNPVRSLDELERLTDPAFVDSLAEHEFWFNRRDRPRLGFPYAGVLFDRNLWSQVRAKLASAINDAQPRPRVDLWDDAEARELMFAILDRFAAEARGRGAEPLILVLPRKRDVTATLALGRRPAGVDILEAYANSRGVRFFDGTRVLAVAAATRAVDDLLTSHLTALGNEVLGRGLHDFLVTEGLVQEASDG